MVIFRTISCALSLIIAFLFCLVVHNSSGLLCFHQFHVWYKMIFRTISCAPSLIIASRFAYLAPLTIHLVFFASMFDTAIFIYGPAKFRRIEVSVIQYRSLRWSWSPPSQIFIILRISSSLQVENLRFRSYWANPAELGSIIGHYWAWRLGFVIVFQK